MDNKHRITISAKSSKERFERIRELLKRGYVPVKLYEKRREYVGVTDNNYQASEGVTRRTRATQINTKYCAVLEKRGERI